MKSTILSAFIITLTQAAIAATTDAPNTLKSERNKFLSEASWPKAECDANVTPEPLGAHRIDLRDGSSWIQVDCERFAYQGSQLIYIENGKKRAALKFKQFNSESESDLQPYSSKVLTGLTTLKPESMRIEVFRKYRGIGDCGQLLTYSVTRTSTKLITLRVRNCPLMPEKNVPAPSTWPMKRL
jgi:hypothetical protein